MEWTKGEYRLTDDPTRVDVPAVVDLLSHSYWAAQRSAEMIEKSIRHSICFALIHRDRQVGFARAITDQATFAWICDVIVHPDHRGGGLGKWMMHCLLKHPHLQTSSQVLRTKDAHGLYEPFGFKKTEYLRRSVEEAGTPHGIEVNSSNSSAP